MAWIALERASANCKMRQRPGPRPGYGGPHLETRTNQSQAGPLGVSSLNELVISTVAESGPEIWEASRVTIGQTHLLKELRTNHKRSLGMKFKEKMYIKTTRLPATD